MLLPSASMALNPLNGAAHITEILSPPCHLYPVFQRSLDVCSHTLIDMVHCSLTFNQDQQLQRGMKDTTWSVKHHFDTGMQTTERMM